VPGTNHPNYYHSSQTLGCELRDFEAFAVFQKGRKAASGPLAQGLDPPLQSFQSLHAPGHSRRDDILKGVALGTRITPGKRAVHTFLNYYTLYS